MKIIALTSIRLVAGVLALALMAVAVVADPKPSAPAPVTESPDALRAYVQEVTAGAALQVGRLTVVPLEHPQGGHLRYVQGHPSLLQASLQRVVGDRVTLRLRNDTSRAILVTAGRVTYVDGAEFVLARDVLVPGKGHRNASAWAVRDDDTSLDLEQSLRWYPRWAPKAVSKQLALRDEPAALNQLVQPASDPERNAEDPTLRALLSSEAGRSLDPKLAKILHDEAFRGPNVVGFVLGIDGRPVGLHLFGSAALHRSKAAGLLGSFGLYAHRLDAQADALPFRAREGADARRAVHAATRDLLHTLQHKSEFTHGEGRTVTVKGAGVTGFGSIHGGAPLHLTIKPGDPVRGLIFPAGGA